MSTETLSTQRIPRTRFEEIKYEASLKFNAMNLGFLAVSLTTAVVGAYPTFALLTGR